ncbi:sorting and assembly machinery component 50 homolog B-like protein [Tanacetum coccineum]
MNFTSDVCIEELGNHSEGCTWAHISLICWEAALAAFSGTGISPIRHEAALAAFSGLRCKKNQTCHRSWSLDGLLKLKNMLGYGDNWYNSFSYGWDQTIEVSTGVSLPKFMRLVNPVTARLSLISQD